MPISLDNPILANAITFLLTSYDRSRNIDPYFFNSMPRVVMNADLAVSFLDAFLSLKQKDKTVYQFNFTSIHGPLSAKPIIAVMDYVNQNQIDCVPVIHINKLIDEELLDVLIQYRCLFQISHDLQEQDFIQIKNGRPVDKAIIKIFSRIKKSNLPLIYSTTITQQNVKEMPMMVKFASSAGACGMIFKINDNLPTATDDSLSRPNRDLYIKYLIKSLKLAVANDLEIVLPELARLEDRGDTPQSSKLVLLPDGFISTTKKYKTERDSGANNAIIGQFSQQGGIRFFQERINTIINNFKTNVLYHCTACKCFIYCRGRNPNLRSFKEQISDHKDDYSCDITRDIYDFLISIYQP